MTDNETTEQLAAATGSVKVTDVGVGGLLAGRPGGISGIGWSNSNERQSDHRRVFRRAQQTGHPGARDAGHRAAAAEPGDGEEGVALTGSRRGGSAGGDSDSGWFGLFFESNVPVAEAFITRPAINYVAMRGVDE